MTVTKTVSQPTRSYQISLSIKGTEYDVSNVKVISTLASAWQVVTIDLFLDPKDIIINQIYGQDAVKIIIQLFAEEQIPASSITFNLMTIGSDFQVPMSEELSTGKQSDRSLMRLITIPRKPFETMTSFVNAIYGVTDNPLTPIEVVEQLVNNYTTTGAKLIYDSEGLNSDKIPQICIPPVILYKAIEYIDRDFGLYDGVPVTFCQYDNTINVMNLAKRMTKSQTITIKQPATTGSDKNTKDIEKSIDGKHFYTYDNIISSYAGNATFSELGSSIRHIVSPNDTLYHTVNQELLDILSNYSVVDKNKSAPIIDSVFNRKKYYIDHGGFNYSESFGNSMISKRIYDMSRISLMLERNIIADELLKVGSVIKFNSSTSEHSSLTGKYILFMSEVMWNKNTDWEATAKIEMVRSNKTIT